MKNLLWIALALIGFQYFTSQEKEKTFLGKLKEKLTGGGSPPNDDNTGTDVQLQNEDIAGVSKSEQLDLLTIAKGIYTQLKGLTSKAEISEFTALILRVKSDNAYRYLSAIFPRVSGGKSLEKMISQQLRINRSLIESINDDFQRKGMLTRLNK